MFDKSYQEQAKQLVAIDCSIFGYENGALKILLFCRNIEPCKGELSLIGGWVNIDEPVEGAAARVLKKITGLDHIAMDLVGVFSNPDRDPGARVITVAFNALIDIVAHKKSISGTFGANWFDVSQVPPLIFDHDIIFNKSLEKLRKKASHHLVGLDLLPPEFTIAQLRQLYNSIFQREFDPGNFRKKILSLNVLKRLDKKDSSDSKKGSYFYAPVNKDKLVGLGSIVKT
jgi:8-oxo-dGTP diphosphatase